MSIGRTRSCRSRSRSSTALPSCRSGRATGSCGTRPLWRSIGLRERLNLDPSCGRLLAGMDGAAGLALARFLVGIERLVERRQVLHQMLDFHLDAVNQCAALEAVPFEGVECVGPRRLDHQSDRAFLRPLRGMTDVRREEEDVALPYRDVVEIAVVDDLEHHVALELIEELFHRIIVVVGALVRPADDLHGHVAGLEHLLVADRRLEQVLMLLDPALEVEGAQTSARHGLLLRSSRAAMRSMLLDRKSRSGAGDPCYLIRLVILSTIGLGVA